MFVSVWTEYDPFNLNHTIRRQSELHASRQPYIITLNCMKVPYKANIVAVTYQNICATVNKCWNLRHMPRITLEQTPAKK